MSQIITQLRQRWTRDRFARHTEQFLPALYRTARRLTRDAADADDLVNDTYVKAFQAFDQAELQSEDACRAWLFRIMVNAYRDRYRRQQRSPERLAMEREADSPVIETAASSEPDPEARLGHKLFAEAAQAAIASLSSEVRLVVTLFFVEGLAYREIAEIADCPIGTVMSRLSRGRRRLQQQLRDYHDASHDQAEISSQSTGPMSTAQSSSRRGSSMT